MLFAMLNPKLPLLNKFYFLIGLGSYEKAGRFCCNVCKLSIHVMPGHFAFETRSPSPTAMICSSFTESQIFMASTTSFPWVKDWCLRSQEAVVGVHKSQVLPPPWQEDIGKGAEN